jgi:hypothetical protein
MVGALSIVIRGVSPVSVGVSATCVPLHRFGELSRVEKDDAVSFRPYSSRVPELAQGAHHDFAHRADCIRQTLLGDPDSQLSIRIAAVLLRRGEVEKLAGDTLTNGSERRPRDLVDEVAGALAQLDEEGAGNPQISLRESPDLRWGQIRSSVSTSACFVAGSANSPENSDMAPKSSPDRQ